MHGRRRRRRRYSFIVYIQYVYRRTVATRKTLMTRAQALSSGGVVPLALSARTIDLRFTSRGPPRRRVSSVSFRLVWFFFLFIPGTLSPDTPYIRAAVCDARASRPHTARHVAPPTPLRVTPPPTPPQGRPPRRQRVAVLTATPGPPAAYTRPADVYISRNRALVNDARRSGRPSSRPPSSSAAANGRGFPRQRTAPGHRHRRYVCDVTPRKITTG